MKIKHIFACLVISLGLIVSYAASVNADSGMIQTYENWPTELKQYTKEECDRYDVDYSLVLAIIYNESRFQSGLTHLNSNGTTDYGLMQVNEVNFDFLRETVGIKSMRDVLDDKTGIRCGIELLAYHKDFTGDDSSALLRYQIGAGKYRKYLQRGRYTNETHSRVLTYQNEFAEYLKRIEQASIDSAEDRMSSLFHRWSKIHLICWCGAMAAQLICNQ